MLSKHYPRSINISTTFIKTKNTPLKDVESHLFDKTYCNILKT